LFQVLNPLEVFTHLPTPDSPFEAHAAVSATTPKSCYMPAQSREACDRVLVFARSTHVSRLWKNEGHDVESKGRERVSDKVLAASGGNIAAQHSAASEAELENQCEEEH